MAAKQKYQIEFEIKSSPKILYPYLSTPSGLNEWFADKVVVNGGTFQFEWNGSAENAKVAGKKDNLFVRFEWLDRKEDAKNNYFQFDIIQDELTSDVALVITDFSTPEDLVENKLLWANTIQNLKHIIGGS
jgi:uncharacterized protein YndB with AHSA1/START domain